MKVFSFLLFGRNKKVESKLTNFHNLLNNSFGNVKRDVFTISQWLTYLYHKNLEQEQLINQLHNYIEELKNSHLQLHKSHSELYQKHIEVLPKIEALKSEISIKHEPIIQSQVLRSEVIDDFKKRLQNIEAKKSKIKEKIIKKVTKNSKDYIKSVILSYLKKHSKMTALQLKEMIVDDQGLCSKSSFYRLLNEIEQNEDIGTIQQGKEKYYSFKISSKLYS